MLEELKNRYSKFANAVSLYNSVLLSIQPDLTRDGAFTLTVTHAFPPILDRNILLLKQCMRGEVFDLRFGENTDFTEFGWWPWDKEELL